MRTAVITGATGTIGRALIDTCIASGYHVLAVVHRDTKRASGIEGIKNCQILRLDLSEYDDAMNQISEQGIDLTGYELFFHLAWMAPSGSGRNNLDLQLDNVEYALSAVRFAEKLGCTTFIGTGSQAEYGRIEGILSPSTPTNPETGYGVAKLSAGQFTRLLCEQLGLRHIWARILSVYGPYDREQAIISTAVAKMARNEETQFTRCEQMWDFIFSEDAARALLIAAEKGESGKIYVIGSGEVNPLEYYIRKIAEITGYSKEIGFGKIPYNDKQVMHLQADISSLREIGFRIENTFEQGIEKTLSWMKR